MARVNKINVDIVPTLLTAANGNRKALMIKNNGAGSIFLGDTDQISIATGLEIPQGQQLAITGDTDAYWGISAAGIIPVDVVEVL